MTRLLLSCLGLVLAVIGVGMLAIQVAATKQSRRLFPMDPPQPFEDFEPLSEAEVIDFSAWAERAK